MQPSAIQGHGLFAVADIAKGDCVMRLGGDVIGDGELAELAVESWSS